MIFFPNRAALAGLAHPLTRELVRLAGGLAAERATASVEPLGAPHEGLAVPGAVARQHGRRALRAARHHLQHAHTAQQLHLQGTWGRTHTHTHTHTHTR